MDHFLGYAGHFWLLPFGHDEQKLLRIGSCCLGELQKIDDVIFLHGYFESFLKHG